MAKKKNNKAKINPIIVLLIIIGFFMTSPGGFFQFALIPSGGFEADPSCTFITNVPTGDDYGQPGAWITTDIGAGMESFGYVQTIVSPQRVTFRASQYNMNAAGTAIALTENSCGSSLTQYGYETSLRYSYPSCEGYFWIGDLIGEVNVQVGTTPTSFLYHDSSDSGELWLCAPDGVGVYRYVRFDDSDADRVKVSADAYTTGDQTESTCTIAGFTCAFGTPLPVTTLDGSTVCTRTGYPDNVYITQGASTYEYTRIPPEILVCEECDFLPIPETKCEGYEQFSCQDNLRWSDTGNIVLNQCGVTCVDDTVCGVGEVCNMVTYTCEADLEETLADLQVLIAEAEGLSVDEVNQLIADNSLDTNEATILINSITFTEQETTNLIQTMIDDQTISQAEATILINNLIASNTLNQTQIETIVQGLIDSQTLDETEITNLITSLSISEAEVNALLAPLSQQVATTNTTLSSVIANIEDQGLNPYEVGTYITTLQSDLSLTNTELQDLISDITVDQSYTIEEVGQMISQIPTITSSISLLTEAIDSLNTSALSEGAVISIIQTELGANYFTTEQIGDIVGDLEGAADLQAEMISAINLTLIDTADIITGLQSNETAQAILLSELQLDFEEQVTTLSLMEDQIANFTLLLDNMNISPTDYNDTLLQIQGDIAALSSQVSTKASTTDLNSVKQRVAALEAKKTVPTTVAGEDNKMLYIGIAIVALLYFMRAGGRGKKRGK